MNLSFESIRHPVYSVVGDRYVFLLTGAQTAGAYSVFEFFIPPGGGSPPHVHRREDEAFYVVEGEFDFHVDGQIIRVGPGQSLFGKRDIPHHFTNIGQTNGIMICTVTPSGLEDFFAEAGTPLDNRESAPLPPGPADIDRLVKAAPKYGIELL